jgi:hypothetical protein
VRPTISFQVAKREAISCRHPAAVSWRRRGRKCGDRALRQDRKRWVPPAEWNRFIARRPRLRNPPDQHAPPLPRPRHHHRHRRGIDTMLSIGVRSRARSRRGGPPSPVGRDPGHRPGLRDRRRRYRRVGAGADRDGADAGGLGGLPRVAAPAITGIWRCSRPRCRMCVSSPRRCWARCGLPAPGHRAAHGRGRSAERVVRRVGRPRRSTRSRHVVGASGWQCPSLPAGAASVSTTCCPSGVMVKRHWVAAGRPACSHRW